MNAVVYLCMYSSEFMNVVVYVCMYSSEFMYVVVYVCMYRPSKASSVPEVVLSAVDLAP